MFKTVKALFVLCLGCLLLTGCESVPETTSVTNKSTMAVSTAEIGGTIADFNDNTLVILLDVPGEVFKLETSFGTGDYLVENWRTTDVKCLNLNAHTVGLPEDTAVYIDNIHIDSVIKSLYAAFDAIPIDTMDDRTHTSLYPGFPISDSIYYRGIFAVGGYSKTLTEGYVSGYNTSGVGSVSGYIKESRITESTLRKSMVYGNMFQIVWDLWIQKPENEYPYMTSVVTEFIIPTEFERNEYLVRYNGKTFDAIDSEGNKSKHVFINGSFREES